MTNFVLFWVLATLLLTTAQAAEAQQPTKIPRVGYVVGGIDPSTSSPTLEIFRQGLRDLGYIEGKNIHVEYRYVEAKQDRFQSIVAELVQLKVDVLVSPTFRAIRAAKQATQTIPIVMVITEDPVATGLVESLARPGGNITGITRLTRELSGKRLELLKEALPAISRVGVLWEANTTSPLAAYETAANALRISLQSLEVRDPKSDFDAAFQAATKGRVGALIMVRTSLLVRNRRQIADLAIKNRLPSMSAGSDFADAGGLISYATSDVESFKRAAVYVDKILKGANPADLPVEQPTKFELVINLKTAKALNLTIPQSVLYRANKVIK